LPLTLEAGVPGRRLFRVRETHLRDHYVPLLRSKAIGAVKVDLILRAIGRALPNTDGRLPTDISWAQIHDLARPGDFYAEPKLKQKWVGEQMQRLENLRLLRRHLSPGGRPAVVVLADDASGRPLDDPDGQPPDSYVSILGRVMGDGRLCRWGAAEIAAYLAAMIAERYARSDPLLAGTWDLEKRPLGRGRWFRPLSWFADREGLRPPHHVRTPFSEHTLWRGFQRLQSQGFVSTYRVRLDPRKGTKFPEGTRTIYTNRF
jgi:hypothetical protein